MFWGFFYIFYFILFTKQDTRSPFFNRPEMNHKSVKIHAFKIIVIQILIWIMHFLAFCSLLIETEAYQRHLNDKSMDFLSLY